MPTISPKAAAKLPEILETLREMNRNLEAILAIVEPPTPRKRAKAVAS